MKTIFAFCVFCASITATFAIALGELRNLPSLPDGLRDTDFSLPPSVKIVDPYRIINGETQRVNRAWVAFSGNVEQVHSDRGFRITGMIEGVYQDNDFFITNFPYPVAEKDYLPPAGYVFLVKDAGTYTYSTAAGSTRTIHMYDYGIPWRPPPPTPEQIAAEKAAEKAALDARVKAAITNSLKSDEDAASNNEPYGLLKMGERYRDGDGVETNTLKARFYFIRAADGGSEDASNELSNLKK